MDAILEPKTILMISGGVMSLIICFNIGESCSCLPFEGTLFKRFVVYTIMGFWTIIGSLLLIILMVGGIVGMIFTVGSLIKWIF